MAGTHRLLAAAVIILLATGCGLSGQTAVNGPIGGNSRTATLPEGDSTLLFWGADAAVRGTVLDMGVSTEEDYRANGGYPVVSVRVDEILWLESPDPAFPFPKLAEGAQTKVIVRSPPSAAEDLKRGDPYVLFLSPGAYFSGPEGSVIAPDYWSLRFGLEPGGTPLPVYDTEADRAVIAALLEPDEGRSDVVPALIEYAEEANTASRTWENPTIGRRLGRVRDLYDPGWRDDATPPDPVETWMEIDPAQRHLPAGPDDIPPGLTDRLGYDLIPYEIVVINGDMLDNEEAISLFIEEVGVLGAHIVDHPRGATIITGMGPPSGGPWPVHLVGWPKDAVLLGAKDSQVAPAPTDTLLDLTSTIEAADRSSAPGPASSDGVYGVIDLRTTPAYVEFLSDADFQARLLDLQPLLDQEPTDPSDPNPSG